MSFETKNQRSFKKLMMPKYFFDFSISKCYNIIEIPLNLGKAFIAIFFAHIIRFLI
jgi:hypothetical protein